MTDEQLRINAAYVADCIASVVKSSTDDDLNATLLDWKDYLTGNTYAPAPGQTWSDVKQPDNSTNVTTVEEAHAAMATVSSYLLGRRTQ